MNAQVTHRSNKDSMHIVVDMQGAQGSNRYRGMGRYSEALALALSRIAAPRHRVTLLLNGAFADTIAPIRAAFAVLSSPPDIQIWHPLSSSQASDSRNKWRRSASEMIFEAVVLKLAPDVLLELSLFEGFGDSVISSVHGRPGMPPTAVVLYDLIPLINPILYLNDPSVLRWYHNRLAHFRRGDVLLGISESSCKEALDFLNVDSLGFDLMDQKLLLALIEKFNGGPVGLESLAAFINEEKGTIEDVIEPFLIQQGFMLRTPRGRMVTQHAYQHFGLKVPEKLVNPHTLNLFEDTSVVAT